MFTVGILTASDKASGGKRQDQSGMVITEIINNLGWKVENYLVVADDTAQIKSALLSMCDNQKINLILTSGGTGFGPRDNTPEATKAVIEREVPGIPEVMRWESMKKTPRAMLSRAVAGIRKQTLIINLPGSPKAVRECLEVILPALTHGLEILNGQTGECGQN
ncbi:MAG TPA: molybdenum cofactor biosynthesis protein [Desulfotomaculum sp.]|nr:molybdenum cofactor biosynthesis protein [Desulfotomaculum sp.]